MASFFFRLITPLMRRQRLILFVALQSQVRLSSKRCCFQVASKEIKASASVSCVLTLNPFGYGSQTSMVFIPSRLFSLLHIFVVYSARCALLIPILDTYSFNIHVSRTCLFIFVTNYILAPYGRSKIP